MVGTRTELQLSVKFKTDVHVVTLPSSALVADLQTKLAELTAVPPALQKLLSKGQLSPELTLAEAMKEQDPTYFAGMIGKWYAPEKRSILDRVR